ncbi:glycosyltransferase family 2 protein [Prevotella sp. PINT]|jgi:Glycosyltransferases involved in cell wall biogenesis|uniref:glycosyltransferase family 2 protein n=1 Tax=Palleniella intestinalis TaxID=2736291 RepID=UPI001557BB1E|nr:glycosyltransferase family 2 protein [Palleniella intestinalis]NPD83102.1 glycosyltransferase family 2 protein [Palleniella intestinalis]
MISVCIATYNGEKYIHRQLESILKQLTDNDEIIISDDMSTDSTLDVIRSIGSPLIHVYINEKEHGYTPNFENAIAHAKGEYIFLSDQDDIWVEDKVQTCMQYLKKHSLIVHDADIVDKSENKIAESFYESRKSKPGIINNLIKFSYLGCCIAFRRKILEKALPFPPNHKMCTHDNWLFISAAFFFDAVVISDKLIHYRRHANNVSSGGFKETTSLIFKIKYRIYLVIWLFLRTVR